MKIAVVNMKGGIGKTTVAAHTAAVLNLNGKTVLVDSDDTKNSTNWNKRGVEAGKGFGFDVLTLDEFSTSTTKYKHTVYDTGQRPTREDLQEISKLADLLVLPGVPLGPEIEGLVQTIQELRALGIGKYKVLLNKVRTGKEDGTQLREDLVGMGVPVFKNEIPSHIVFSHVFAEGLLVNQSKGAASKSAWQAYLSLGMELVKG